MWVFFPLFFLLLVTRYFFDRAECISQKKRLGGLLFLLPKIFGSDDTKNDGTKCPNNGEGTVKNLLGELERLLVHENIPVSVAKQLLVFLHFKRYFNICSVLIFRILYVYSL